MVVRRFDSNSYLKSTIINFKNITSDYSDFFNFMHLYIYIYIMLIMWTNEELNIAINLIENGNNFKEISDKLNKTHVSVTKKFLIN
jgi:hypothetical protein